MLIKDAVNSISQVGLARELDREYRDLNATYQRELSALCAKFEPIIDHLMLIEIRHDDDDNVIAMIDEKSGEVLFGDSDANYDYVCSAYEWLRDMERFCEYYSSDRGFREQNLWDSSYC